MNTNLRVAIVANANSIHTIRWVDWLKKKGHSVAVFSLQKSETGAYFGPEPPLNRRFVLNLGRGVRKTTALLQKLIDEFKPDVVHGFYLTNHGMYASRIIGYPIVVTAMGSDVLLAPSESRLLAWLTKRTVRNSDCVIAPPLLLNELNKWKLNKNKVISNLIGVDCDLFKPRKKENLVLFSRGFNEIYNPLTVAKAILKIAPLFSGIKFCLAGNGLLKAEVEALLNNLEADIEFPGYLSQDELARIMGSSKIVISPSLSDSIPLTAFEAMACGSVLVASDIAAHKQWTDRDYPLLLFETQNHNDLAEQIVKVLKDETIVDQAIANGPNLVKRNWSWDSQADAVLAEYRTLVQ